MIHAELKSERDGMPEIVIRPPGRFARIDLRELFAYRGLVYSMARRRVRLQFDRQYLAWFWAVARPLILVAIFELFRNLSSAKTGVQIPYTLYVYSGLVLWFFFTEAVAETATSIKRDSGLIKKIYFPRLVSPMVSIISNLIIASISLIPLIVMMIVHSVAPDARLLLLPVVIMQTVLLVFGLGCVFAALSLLSDDWEKLLGFVLYVGLFVSPVIYSVGMIPDSAKVVFSLNPMVGSLLAFRAALFADFPWPMWEWWYSLSFSFAVTVLGLLMFQKAETAFVDNL